MKIAFSFDCGRGDDRPRSCGKVPGERDRPQNYRATGNLRAAVVSAARVIDKQGTNFRPFVRDPPGMISLRQPH